MQLHYLFLNGTIGHISNVKCTQLAVVVVVVLEVQKFGKAQYADIRSVNRCCCCGIGKGTSSVQR